MKIHPWFCRLPTLLVVAFGLAVGTSFPASADNVQVESGPLSDAILQGQKLFMSEKFGGNGKTCNSCHPDGGKSGSALPDGRKIPALHNAAAIFPRYHPRKDRIFTLSDQVRHCIGEIKGKPPEYASAELNAIVSYVSSLSEGQTIDLGGLPK